MFRLLSLLLLLFNAVSAFYGGLHLIFNPDGTSLGMPLEFLEGSPFRDFLIPGIILFILVGVLSFIVFIIGLIKNKFFLPLLVAEGIILSIWILAQIAIIKELSYLQLIYGLSGAFMVALGLLQMTLVKRMKSGEK